MLQSKCDSCYITTVIFIKTKPLEQQAIPEDVNSFSSWWIRRSVNTKVTVIIFIYVDGIVLTNAVLHYLIINSTTASVIIYLILLPLGCIAVLCTQMWPTVTD